MRLGALESLILFVKTETQPR